MASGISEINELRSNFLEFFERKGHLVHPSAPLRSSDPGLLFNVAGMQQFKPYFQGATPRFAGHGVHHRVVTAQKCMRAGGKDSDIENVGRTRRHNTFFEMLGNFSFGEYFKREACLYAWEYLTSGEWLGLDPERLYVTVFTDDDEAHDIWANVVGVPEERISRFGEAENFWPANAIKEQRLGPCGPCSEIFYDRGPAYGTPGETGPNTGSGDRFLEVWNLVFMQYSLEEGGELTPLPQQNIDTGMGLERLAALMTGEKDAFATELFMPIIRLIVEYSGVPYEDVASVAHRIIADHVRAAAFAIADGILPANDGAGYVIKMLIRRASRQAFLLGVEEPVLFKLAGAVVDTMRDPYPELVEKRELIERTLKAEEEQFLRTLESGTSRVESLLAELEGGVMSGEVAFDLWQTYGFPLDLTAEMAAEKGVSVDREGYEAAREAARRLSRGEGQRQLFAEEDAGALRALEGLPDSEFVGYESVSAEAEVLALLSSDGEPTGRLSEGESGAVVLDRTPFYAEGGGQVGDAGKLTWEGGAAVVKGTPAAPTGVQRHEVRVARGALSAGLRVTAAVDPARREIMKHHTATHLLHAALREALGAHVAQAGSLVEAGRLRFDFSHPAALTEDEIVRIERMVNRHVQADLPVAWRVVSLEEARSHGAMMLFGEKYGESVRMVSIGGSGAVSVELCGGTHVSRTGEIGAFYITDSGAVSAGVRRIEAVAGAAAVEYVQQARSLTRRLSAHLGGSAAELEERALKLQADLREAQRESATLRDRLAAAQTRGAAASELLNAGGFSYATAALDGLDAAALRNAADSLLASSGADLVVVGSGKLLVAKTSEGARARGANAGTLVRNVAAAVGGGGGGRPDMAQAGIRDEGALKEALAAVGAALAGGKPG